METDYLPHSWLPFSLDSWTRTTDQLTEALIKHGAPVTITWAARTIKRLHNLHNKRKLVLRPGHWNNPQPDKIISKPSGGQIIRSPVLRIYRPYNGGNNSCVTYCMVYYQSLCSNKNKHGPSELLWVYSCFVAHIYPPKLFRRFNSLITFNTNCPDEDPCHSRYQNSHPLV